MPWTKPYHPPSNQHLSPELYTHPNRVCFITIRACGDQSPFVHPDLGELTLNVLKEEQNRQNCIILTYCLMPDHLHFLICPKIDGISVLTFTDQFKGKMTNRSWSAGWRGKLWQARHYDHVVRAEESLYEIDRYILNNPVRKGLVSSPEDWPWSGHMNPVPWHS